MSLTLLKYDSPILKLIIQTLILILVASKTLAYNNKMHPTATLRLAIDSYLSGSSKSELAGSSSEVPGDGGLLVGVKTTWATLKSVS